MPGIDSHQHFWKYDPVQYPWIKTDWPIRRDFLPKDLKPLLDRSRLEGCVAVQARQSLEETRWLLELARAHPFIRGVVGWVDLRGDSLERQLAEFAGEPLLVGVRHVVQDEPDDRFMLREDFLRGISCLRRFDLAYDLLIFPKQFPAAIELAARFPDQRFVLDHLGKPSIRDRGLDPWREQMRELAACPNVYCKLSGMVTEARWYQWTEKDFRPYIETAWEAFGPDRLMIGSDWPVCLLSAEFEAAMRIVFRFLESFDSATVEKVLGQNAIRFYRLK